ncbi:glycoside hydrolase family 9 protein [Porcipelethomonas sp.]|uniref:glycoside hydrolase family 9 protein n=1 Tax=Porcipelethomonas sp. TaxID=2981675 RepID=UPI003EF4BC57
MNRMKKVLSFTAAAAAVIYCTIPGVSAQTDENYARALQYSLYMYDANMCGKDVNECTQLTWRNDCHIYDAEVSLTNGTDLSADFITENQKYLDPDADGYIDVSGGFHDAGDFVKFGLPQGFTAATLNLEYMGFKESFEKTGQDSHMKTILTYFNDYLKKCTFTDENGKVIAFCYQVGLGQTDHDYWGAPENQTTERKAYFATEKFPSTDICAISAAAMAGYYVNFGDEQSLEKAMALYDFVNDNPLKQPGTDKADNGFYGSSGYTDELGTAAAWLYTATGDSRYKTDAENYLNEGIYDAPYWAYCWDDSWLGGFALMAIKTGNTEYWNVISEAIDNGIAEYSTPQGYVYYDDWGSARYNTNMQMLGLLHAKYTGNSKYSYWAKEQMSYLMGNNSKNKCYIVGLNENSVKYPHHAAASGSDDPESKAEHKYVLYGALVGGPGSEDEHIDETCDYQYNEVSIDYNAGFVGACAGLYGFFGSGQSIDTALPEEIKQSLSSEESSTKYGDVNLDGYVSSADVIMLNKYLLSSDEYPLENEHSYKNANARYDVDDNGNYILNLEDSACIVNCVLGITPETDLGIQ